ncbi:hypothetical protein F971_01501 [Acinetobacter vivianii]|uniref:Uncharacterized protein n=1 Tax=Acinetobacter vivianii TaxID=1776742 RepID=N8WC60_9GAMM|nr:hypothetical protein [Acinetobacter vivianii]ENU92519.1 hypothetical protein F971_01501 [Acinetobacter vivianii]
MQKPNQFKIMIHSENESIKGQEILFKLECYWKDDIRPNFSDNQKKYLLVSGHAISFCNENEIALHQNIPLIDIDELDSFL